MEVFVKAGRLDCARSVVEILKEGAETISDTPPQGASAGTTVIPGIKLVLCTASFYVSHVEPKLNTCLTRLLFRVQYKAEHETKVDLLPYNTIGDVESVGCTQSCQSYAI